MTTEAYNFVEADPDPVEAPNPKLLAEAQIIVRGLPAKVFAEPEKPTGIAAPAPKLVPQIPYDQGKAQELIKQLGAGGIAARDAAGRQLEGMGMAVLPQLETAQEHKDLEITKRAQALTDRIIRRFKENEFQKWQNDLEQTPGWKELLARSDRVMVHNRDVFLLGPAVAETPKTASSHYRLTPPTPEEQIKIEALIKHLDNLHIGNAEFDAKLNKALAAAIKSDASVDERAEYLTLSWQRRMAAEAPLLYLDTLSKSNNEYDLKKGGRVLMQYLETTSTQDIRKFSNPYDIGNYASKFNIRENGNFVELFLAKVGKEELLPSGRKR